MRIIAGEFRSRILKTLPGEKTRPTLDSVKEAVFSHLGTYFDTGSVLDLFAGSGAISLEALSRGMSHAVLVDVSKEAIKIIKENISNLKVNDRCQIKQCDYKAALDWCYNEQKQFDLIYLDPPYSSQSISQLLGQICDRNLLNDKGTIVAESSLDEEIEAVNGLTIEKQAKYGKIKITYLRKETL